MKIIVSIASILRIIFITLIICFAGYTNAQNVAINTSGAAADPSAMLDVASTTKGFLPPRMTTIQRTGIQSPTDGLMVFDTDTKSYWYFSQIWKEITIGAGGSGFTLPYAGSFSDPAKIFAINNTNTGGGSVAIYGRSGNTGSGIIPPPSMGVWGDNDLGFGIVGTSVNGVGAFGYSFQNHGVSGFSNNNSFAGVFGSHANTGAGIMGQADNNGIGIYGRTTGTAGKAAFFENTNTNGADTVFKVLNNGIGMTGYFGNPNVNNTGSLIVGDNYGKGGGIYMKMWNAQNNFPGFYMYQYGSGDGLYVGSNKSKVARFFANGGNADTAVTVSSDGTGVGLQINLNSGLNTKDAMNVVTKGTGKVAFFEINNSTNSSPVVDITANGTGRGLQVSLSNASNIAAAIHGSTSGNKAIEGIAMNYGVIGQSTALTDGIGVLGQSSLNSTTGIGVKGISYSNVTTNGAVTGMNNADGVGVYGSSVGSNGNGTGVLGIGYGTNSTGVYGAGKQNGVYGITNGPSPVIGVGVFGEVGSSSLGFAGKFVNNNPNNNLNAVYALNYGSGTTVDIVSNNNSNSQPVIDVHSQGTGKLIRLNGSNGENFSVANNGNVNTEGTVTVKGDKGIVRNSTSTQMRVEKINAPITVAGGIDLPNTSYIQLIVTFSTAFSSAPVVYVGNILNHSNSATFVVASVTNVTTTGCKLNLRNASGGTLNGITGAWQLIAMGAE